MPTNTQKKQEQRYQNKKAQRDADHVKLMSLMLRHEAVITHITSTKQFILYTLLTSAAFLAMAPDAMYAQSEKHPNLNQAKPIASKFDQEIPPAIARGTLKSSQAVIPIMGVQALRFSQAPTVILNSVTKDRSKPRLLNAIHRKVSLAKEVVNNAQTRQACALKMHSIAVTEAALPKDNPIAKVIAGKDFSLLCVNNLTTDKNADGKAVVKGTIDARFLHSDTDNTSLILFPMNDKVSIDNHQAKATIRHEFWHARHHQLHTSERCKMANLEHTVAPVFPVTTDNVNLYNEALDKGDQRIIKEFAELRWKKSQGESLTGDEAHLLNTFVAACEHCLVYPVNHRITKTLFDQLIKTAVFSSAGEISVDAHMLIVGFVKITALIKEGDRYSARILPSSAEQQVILIPDHVDGQLRLTHYSKLDIEKKLSERDAYTRQGLSEEAFNTFYHEAAIIFKKYQAYCEPSHR